MLFGTLMFLPGANLVFALNVVVPLSILFGVVCVANQMARRDEEAKLSRLCLSASVELLPMTVTSLAVLLTVHVFMSNLGAGVGFGPDAMQAAALAIGIIAALAVAGNTLLLLLFAWLIRPMIMKSKRPTIPELKVKANPRKTAVVELLTAADMRKALAARSERTTRPSNPHSVRALIDGVAA